MNAYRQIVCNGAPFKVVKVTDRFGEQYHIIASKTGEICTIGRNSESEAQQIADSLNLHAAEWLMTQGTAAEGL